MALPAEPSGVQVPERDPGIGPIAERKMPAVRRKHEAADHVRLQVRKCNRQQWFWFRGDAGQSRVERGRRRAQRLGSRRGRFRSAGEAAKAGQGECQKQGSPAAGGNSFVTTHISSIAENIAFGKLNRE